MKNDLYLKVKQSGEGTLSLACKLTIEKSEELKVILIKALERVKKLLIDPKKLTGIDVSCIQLFCSAARSFQEEKKQISFKSIQSSEVLKKVLINSGFAGNQCISEDFCKNCLWKEIRSDVKNNNGRG